MDVRGPVRPAAPGDASRLAEIQVFAKRTAYRPIFQNDAVSFGNIQVLPMALDYRDRPGALAGVYVYDDGLVRGMARWGPPEGEAPAGALQLHELYVDPFFQGQGVGSALLSAFLEEAAALGTPSVLLWVLAQNAAARRFYEARGLRPDGARDREPGTPEPLLRYAMDL